MISLTPKQKQQLSEHPIIREEESEQLKKENSFKTGFIYEIERDQKESSQVLNSYYGEY